MSGDGVLLDSVIVIDHLNGIDAATEYLLRQVKRVDRSPRVSSAYTTSQPTNDSQPRSSPS